MRLFIAAPFALLLTACATALEPTPFNPAPMQAAAHSAVARIGYQGAALLVDDSGVVWQSFNGAIDCSAEGRPIGPDDLFDMGSVTKVFTGALILRLIDRGELSLDARLSDLLPNVPADKAPITIRQLLFHTSGLREASGEDEVYISRDAMLSQEFAAPLLFAPGSGEEYSNVGYSLLAAIIEQRFNQPYEQVLRRELLAPLDADSIGYTHRPRTGADVCGHWEGRENPNYGSVRDYFGATEPSWHLTGNGALLATPADLARFYHGLVTGRVLSPESTALMQERMARNWYGRDVYITSGSNIVFTTFIAHYRDTGLTFIMMSNDSRAPKERAMRDFNDGLNAVMNELDPAS